MDRLGGRGGDILQAAGEHRVLVFGVIPGPVAQGASQPGIDKGFSQGGAGIADKHLFNNGHHQHFKCIVYVGAKPGEACLALVFKAFAGVCGIIIGCRFRFFPPVLRWNRCFRINSGVIGQNGFLDKREMVLERKIAVGIKKGIARMVVLPVKRMQVRVGQFRDIFGAPPRIVAVRRIRVKGV